MKESWEDLRVGKFNRRLILKSISVGIVLAETLLLSTARAAVRVGAPDELWSDDFDRGNVVGAAPADWKTKVAPGITTRIVDATVTEPDSAPYCVELREANLKERAEMWRDFPPTDAGNITASFKLKSLATAHAGLQLRTAKGVHLCSIFFVKEGVMRFDHQGGMERTSVTWAPGKWQKVHLEWFSDSTFSAVLEGRSIVDHARFVSNGIPGRLEIVVGSSSVSNKIAYVDNVKVLRASPP
jgi:hypothetical protein